MKTQTTKRATDNCTDMKVKSNAKAGGVQVNQDQTTVRASKGLKVKSSAKAGGTQLQHNQTVMGLRIKAGVKAGGFQLNHNQTMQGAV